MKSLKESKALTLDEALEAATAVLNEAPGSSNQDKLLELCSKILEETEFVLVLAMWVHTTGMLKEVLHPSTVRLMVDAVDRDPPKSRGQDA